MAIINHPYSYTPEEITLLVSQTPQSAQDWKKPCFKRIKQKIKEHLTNEQGRKCCYCLNNPTLTSHFQIEHIAPKGKHVKFMFENKNLALACQMCNNFKHEKETLLDPETISYPTSGNSFIIIHPHFDNYSEHLEIIDEIFIKAKTEKGENTISFCKLARLNYAEDRSKNVKDNVEERPKKALLNLIRRETNQEEINSLLSSVGL